jgi:acetylglutamate kinase
MSDTGLHVIKIGGNVIDNPARLDAFLERFAALGGKKILVHGGGKIATEIAEKLDVPQQMHQGRRITDAGTLKIVTMVYAGLINKNIVAKLQASGANAIGLTGADFNLMTAVRRPVKEIDYGFVGDFHDGSVNTGNLTYLLQNAVPVLCSIAHDGQGNLLNVNADTFATELAVAMSKYYKTNLLYCFEKKGVLLNPDDDDSVIPAIDPEKYAFLKENRIISNGMLPKLENAFAALQKGVCSVNILRDDNFTLFVNDGKNYGTRITGN